MFSLIAAARKSVGRLLIAPLALLAAACVPNTDLGSSGQKSDRSGAVKVALLVPGGSGNASDQLIATSVENAARLAMRDLANTAIDLRVYQTYGSPEKARVAALQAADEGAEIVLGPVYGPEANSAGKALAARGINVLTLSNNTDIAGNNVFLLGPTFDNTARRLANYGQRQGRNRVMIVHEKNAVGETGRAAIQRGVAAAGSSVVASVGYEFSQSGVTAAAPTIVQTARETGANAMFLTADSAGALPLLTQQLIDNGLDRNQTKYLGVTRWDANAQTLGLPSVQGGWFALPDPNLYAQFQSRYQAAYGATPHATAALAYDGIAAIGALARQGKELSAASLTQSAGFNGVSGIFRFNANGVNERGLAVAEIRNNQVVIVDPAPRSFSSAGY